MKRTIALLIAPTIIAVAAFTTSAGAQLPNCLDYLSGEDKFEKKVVHYLRIKKDSQESYRRMLGASEWAYRATKHAAQEAFRQAKTVADMRYLQAEKDAANVYQIADHAAQKAYKQRVADSHTTYRRARKNAKRVYNLARHEADQKFESAKQQAFEFARQFRIEHFGGFRGRTKFDNQLFVPFPSTESRIIQQQLEYAEIAREADHKKAKTRMRNTLQAIKGKRDLHRRQAAEALGRDRERANVVKKNALEAAGHDRGQELKHARSARENALKDAEAEQAARSKTVESARVAAEKAAKAYSKNRNQAKRTLGDTYINAYANPYGPRRKVSGYPREIVLKVAVHERRNHCPPILKKQPEPR